jgi:hypothetical protein
LNHFGNLQFEDIPPPPPPVVVAANDIEFCNNFVLFTILRVLRIKF